MHLFTVYNVHMRVPWYVNFVVKKMYTYYRYSFVKSCWALMPMSRPTFADLVKQLSGYLGYIASYVILSDVNKESKDIEVKCSDN